MRNGVELGQVKVMEIVTIHDNLAYFIEYHIEPKDYQKYLPLAQKMIDTFHITSSGLK